MTEINLLPEELREKEEKEIAAVKKRPKSFAVEMSQPLAEPIARLPASRPSILSRLFAKSPKSSRSRPSQPPLVTRKDEETAVKSKPAKKYFYFSKVRQRQPEARIDLTKDFSAKSDSPPPNHQDSKAGKEKFIKGKSELKKNWWQRLAYLFRRQPKKTLSQAIAKSLSEKDNEQRPAAVNDKVLDVDLIPKELSKYPELELPKKIFKAGVALLLTILAVGLIYLGITWYQLKTENQLRQLESEIAELNNQIAVYEKEKTAAQKLQKKLIVIREMLNNHVYWTKFFSLLEKYTIQEVYYTNFSMAGTDSLVLAAVGKDYKSVAKQLVAFEQADNFVAAVEINAASANLDEDGDYSSVEFSINLTLLSDVFKKPLE